MTVADLKPGDTFVLVCGLGVVRTYLGKGRFLVHGKYGDVERDLTGIKTMAEIELIETELTHLKRLVQELAET